MSEVVLQIIQVFGSLFILTAFVAVPVRRLEPERWSYLVLNLIGSAILTVTGAFAYQWGFVLLEGVWAPVSLASLLGVSGRRTPGTLIDRRRWPEPDDPTVPPWRTGRVSWPLVPPAAHELAGSIQRGLSPGLGRRCASPRP